MAFVERLDAAIERSGSLLCVGLDPDGFEDAAAAERFCLETMQGALPYACAVKPNLAFFEQLGSAGYAVLERLRGHLPAERLLILDGKRGDIGSTAQAYMRALFDVLGADAVTVNPLMGEDAVAPFLQRRGRGVFIVARSSNPGAADLLEQRLFDGSEVYERIVELGLGWDPGGAVGFVVGATAVDAVAAVRAAAPEAPLLLPGVGAQGGSLEDAVRAGVDARGGRLLVAVSRGIAQAAEGPGAAAASLAGRIAAVRYVEARA
ncbi:MAG: orotidine-5'-phosphate decarboxylase [Candidatus Dormibacteraeota bacterium]|nr:orotidine-5'-phosphate decarboxylase [Candidatus Dormibacteraeota bacterium]